uniref:Yippee domain-containing protein n=1 Tax=Solanum tuberosum TaxID=4113 RepID=M1DX48_SOLTU
MSCVLCRFCGTRVAFVEDYISIVWILTLLLELLMDLIAATPQIMCVREGIFLMKLFNVVVRDNVKNHQRLLGTAVAKANCVQCGVTLGWKYIEVTPQNSLIREGKFLMILKKLCLWNDVPLLHIKKVQDLHTYEENADQDGATNEENVDQDGDMNEENVDQDGDINEHEVGANEQNVDQGGGSNELNHEEDVGVIRFNVRNFLTHFINKNAYQGGGGNELNHEQDVGANEQNADQDGGANEQNSDQDGGANEQGPSDQDGGPPIK